MSEFKFEKLLEPIQIGSMKLRNRIIMPPMVTNYAAEDGAVTERFKAYHQTRAKGGVGLIIVEATYIHPGGKGFQNQLGIYKDELISGLKELTEAVHKYGAKIAVQLYHAGRQTTLKVTGMQVVAPSPIPCPVKQEKPKELSVDEIKELIEAFGQAARRAKEAGFDAVEIHGAHGYLINQFLSPYSNKRTDEYGGSFENRMRFPLEVVRRVREEVGPDFPIIYRMSAEEYVPGGLTIEDTKIFAQKLVEEGIDALHISGGVYESSAMIIQPAAIPQGCFVENAAAIKKAINSKVPVIVVGRIKDPIMAEQIIREGKADLVSMGRALLADPELPRKVSEGKIEEIRKCIGCNQGCIDRLFQDIDIGCIANALTGHETEFDMESLAKTRKKVFIIGGGPGGLEAARVAALRGHEVILYEKQPELGGQMRIAAVPPHKGEINDLADYLINQVEKSGITIVKGKEADLNTIHEIKPDVVILATGSEPIIPEIPGINQKNVVTAHDVLKGTVTVGKKVAVIGGGLVGCETAEFLADQSKEVTVIEMLDDIAIDVGSLVRALLLNRMAEKKIKVLTKSKVKEISGDKVTIETVNGNQELSGIDTIVIAVGSKPKNDLLKLIEKEGIPVYAIGDCVKARKFMDAIHEGFRYAYSL
ncbi:FAD-dependent oxidoreductase [Caldanaerobacter subterraneus]|uniref:2,4-dienoyl-CoA reductase-like NADH-dependent reductase (Old Yellow Enzyme family) n=1 Tax=Caldanaerobacter subterraneus TaxID=911092 RepID=A0A4V2S9D7_9THEO|nr:FAD-dependent oxidoreductase [Caldanaerobacter subterraneus]TCO67480.1 2,4-dienoyl-CoA reductase-like NADH-dependent reductase (Old Yellow Enzyme family) [Caldanaerobacter subterraneus]